MYRGRREVAPASRVDDEHRGAIQGRFCHGCHGVYSLHAAVHRGKPVHGRDHVAAVCPHEGRAFAAGADWWEPAVEVLESAGPG